MWEQSPPSITSSTSKPRQHRRRPLNNRSGRDLIRPRAIERRLRMRVKLWQLLASFCGFAICLSGVVCEAQSISSRLGVFEGQTDVGNVAPPGRAAFDGTHQVYRIDAAGANMWSTVDGFHF